MFGQNLAGILAAEGVADIVSLTQHPLARVNESYAFCHHGGWYECELQSNFLCAYALSGNSSMAQFEFVECVNDQLGFAADPGIFPRLDVKGALDKCATMSKLDSEHFPDTALNL